MGDYTRYVVVELRVYQKQKNKRNRQSAFPPLLAGVGGRGGEGLLVELIIYC